MGAKILTIYLIAVSAVLQGCAAAESQITRIEANSIAPEPTVTPPQPGNAKEGETQEFTNGKVEYKGVSFTYNPQIFGSVKAQEVDEYPLQEKDNKPDGVEPQHRLFTFDLATKYSHMEIAVYPIDDFPRMYAVNQESVKYLTKEVTDFKKVLKDKNFRVDKQIPYLRFIDASQRFQVKVKHFPFQGGSGILFLTFWETQLELPSNRQLRYIFEGLTSDGKYYVLAEMPISVAFLSEDSTQEYEGYKIPEGKEFDGEAVEKRTAEVDKKVGKRLENLPPDEFKPNPKYLEEIISSLEIRN